MRDAVSGRSLRGAGQAGRALQFILIILALLCGATPVRAVEGTALERGTAITDPLALRELDRGRFQPEACPVAGQFDRRADR